MRGGKRVGDGGHLAAPSVSKAYWLRLMAGTVLAGGLETGLSGAPLASSAATVTQRHRRGLLTATALAGGVAAGMFGAPQNALAGCTVTGATTVTCGNTATTDTTFNANPPDHRGFCFPT